MNNEKKFIKLTPFKMQVLQSFPFIDEDFDAITNYELLCKVVEYLNITVENVDLLNKKVEEFENYFDNLDVQDEINNKLDKMAESGELSDIIAQYLGLAGVLSFNTVNDMKNATNLVDGSTAHTLGYYSLNDGGSAYYKIRTITNEDVVDEMLIIALDNNTLIAELIKSSTIDVRQLGAKSEISFDNKNYIQKAIDNFKTIIISENYYTSNAITLNSNISIYGSGKIYTNSPYIFSGNNISNVTIKDIELESNVDTTDTANMSETTPDTRGYTTLSSIIDISNSNNITLNKLKVHGGFTGIFCHGCNNVTVENCNCYESSSKIVCLSQSVYKLINNYIHDISNNEEYYACYLFQSTDSDDIDTQELSIINGNIFENNNVWDAIMMHKYNKINIVNNTIKNVRNGLDLSLTSSNTMESGNIIISNNYIEGTTTDMWAGNSALNHGIFVQGNEYQNNVVINNNIVKNFGKFTSPSGGSVIHIQNTANVNINDNVIVYPATLNTIYGAIHLRGSLNNVNVENNVVESSTLTAVLLNDTTINNLNIMSNIFNNSASYSINSINGNTITNAHFKNIFNSTNEMVFRNTDVINGVTYTADINNPIFNTELRFLKSIESFNLTANSFVNKNISNTDVNYSGVFNIQGLYDVDPANANFPAGCIVRAKYGSSSIIQLTFYNMTSSSLTIPTTNYVIKYIK